MRYAIVIALFILLTGPASAWGPGDPYDHGADPDGDGLGNLDEFLAGTNPMNPDTDGAGCFDGWEVRYGLDPTDPKDDLWDSDHDGWTNLKEFQEGTDPKDPNTDNDIYHIDSTDPHPLRSDGVIPPRRDPNDPPGGGDQGNGNSMGQGQGLYQDAKGLGNGHDDSYRERDRWEQPRPGDAGYDADVDGLLEFIGSL